MKYQNCFALYERKPVVMWNWILSPFDSASEVPTLAASQKSDTLGSLPPFAAPHTNGSFAAFLKFGAICDVKVKVI